MKHRIEMGEGGVYVVSVCGYVPQQQRLGSFFPKVISPEGLFSPEEGTPADILDEMKRFNDVYVEVHEGAIAFMAESRRRCNIGVDEQDVATDLGYSRTGTHRGCLVDAASYDKACAYALADGLAEGLGIKEIFLDPDESVIRRLKDTMNLYKAITSSA